MADLTLHFELSPGADVAATARHIEEQLQASPDVAASSVDRDQATRFVTGVEIIAAITLAGKIAGSVTAIVTALEKLQTLVKTGAADPRVRRILIDVGLRSVPLEELTDADKEVLARQLSIA